eukprot:5866589-Prymnesium_polylepis.1
MRPGARRLGKRFHIRLVGRVGRVANRPSTDRPTELSARMSSPDIRPSRAESNRDNPAHFKSTWVDRVRRPPSRLSAAQLRRHITHHRRAVLAYGELYGTQPVSLARYMPGKPLNRGSADLVSHGGDPGVDISWPWTLFGSKT